MPGTQRVEKLVELRGTLDQPVENVHFVGSTFADAGWLLPSEIGLVDVQANFVDCCVESMGGVGGFAGYTDGTVIGHNEICRLPYSGISLEK